MRGRLAALLAGGAILLLSFLLLGSGGADGEWVPVERGELAVGIEFSGALEAVDSAFVGPPSLQGSFQFRIANLVPEGTPVQAGMPVVSFDASNLARRRADLMARQAEAEAELEKTRIDLAKSEQELDLQIAEVQAKLRKLSLKVDVPEELVAAGQLRKDRIDLELARRELAYLEKKAAMQRRTARGKLASLRSNRDRSRARVEELGAQIAAMNVRAPRPGTVIYLSQRRGEKPKVGDMVHLGTRVLQIPDLTTMRGEGRIDEGDAGRVEVGQEVRLRLDAFPDEELRGWIESIGSTVQRSRVGPMKEIQVDIRLEETDPARMRPKMRFRGEVLAETVEGVLLVPLDAVQVTREGPRVERRRWMGSESVAVTLGRWGGDQVEVLEGLAAGDQVLLPAGGAG